MPAPREGMRSFRLTLKWSTAAVCLLLWVPSGLPAGAWTLPKGKVWAKATYFQQRTDEWYLASPGFDGELFTAGTRRPYRFNGEYDSKVVFLEVTASPTVWTWAYSYPSSIRCSTTTRAWSRPPTPVSAISGYSPS